MCQCRLAGSDISNSRWSQAHYISMGTSLKASRFKSCNVSRRRTWVHVSNGGPVISMEEAEEIASFSTVTK